MTVPSRDPKPSAHHVVLGLRVTGGFLAGAELEFADGLNCLIGGRGAGKTTVLEFLRFGLGLMPDPKINPQRHKAIDALVKANLGSGRLTIDLRTKTDLRYTAGRAANETVQVLNEAGTAVPVSLDRDQIFSADVFSQNEIEDIASSPAAQLELLDRFQEQEAGAVAREMEQLQRELDQSSVDLRRIDQEVDDLRGKASELPVLQEKLKGFAEVAGPDAARINAAHAAKSGRAREEKLPELLIAGLQKVARDISSSQVAFQSSVEAQLDNDVRQGPNREVFEALAADVQTFTQHLASAVESIVVAARTAETQTRTHATALAERHAVQEAEYRTIVAASEEEGGRAAERVALPNSFGYPPRLKLSLARALEQEHKISIDFRKLLHPKDRSEESKGRQLYRSVSKLGKTFVTTNYDEWLDQELPEPVLSLAAPGDAATALAPTKRTVLYKTQDLTPAALNQTNTVIHLHGSVLDSNGLILTTRDYVRHYANDRFAGEPAQENRVLTFLEHLFMHKTVLFIGYGLEELEILEYIILKRRSVLGQQPEARHYLLQGFFSHEEQVLRTLRSYYLNECGIELIPFLRDQKDREQLLAVLEEFARELSPSDPLVLQRAQEMEALLDG